MSDISLSIAAADALAYACLVANGLDEANARAVTDRMLEAERDRCHSHGLFRAPWYANGVASGRVNGAARPQVSSLAPAVLRVDGDAGYAPLGQQVAHAPLAERARETGIAALGLTNMFHIAALWPEVEALAREGLCAFAFTAAYPYVAPAGGTKPLYGTNPMGFAWPRADGPPLVFDQSSSAMARGEIQIAARDGHAVPETAGIGPDGAATTDPDVVLEGAQLGFGGHKGASLALMIELLAGPLIGEFLSFEAAEDDAGAGGPPKGGELLIAIDPSKFGAPDRFLTHGERLFAKIAEQEGTRLPGDRRFAARTETAETGITIPKSLHDEIVALTRDGASGTH
ncbi:MAG: Ldh family oxidoreductase [Pseudomonadota bacterium]